MNTRIASQSDIPEIVRVINLAYRVEDFFINGDRTSAREIASQMADPCVSFLVIDGEQQQLAAAVLLEIRDDRGHFAMLAVDPAYQGKGMGRELISAIEAHCRSAGCTALDIEVVNLRSELPPFYSALGFVPSGTLPFPNQAKLRRDAHLMLMTKSLSI